VFFQARLPDHIEGWLVTFANAKFCAKFAAVIKAEKFCNKCGAKIKAEAKFCPDCGTKQE